MEGFINMNKGINDGGDIPRETLEVLFDWKLKLLLGEFSSFQLKLVWYFILLKNILSK